MKQKNNRTSSNIVDEHADNGIGSVPIRTKSIIVNIE